MEAIPGWRRVFRGSPRQAERGSGKPAPSKWLRDGQARKAMTPGKKGSASLMLQETWEVGSCNMSGAMKNNLFTLREMSWSHAPL